MNNIKAFCRSCKGLRNQIIVHNIPLNGNYEDYLYWNENYQIIKCLGCETISFRYVYGDSEMMGYDEEGDTIYLEDIKIFPAYLKEVNEIEHLHYLPKKIREIYSETVTALKNNLLLLASGGLRACIEAICQDKKITNYSLMEKIDKLSEKGILTINDSRLLHSIRFLGNDALHNIDKPDEKTINILFEIVNHTIESLYVKENKMKDSRYLIIDTIESFVKAIKNNIKDEYVGNILHIDDILGNSKNLIKNNKSKEALIKLFNEKIDNKEITFIEFVDKSNYKIMRVPSSSFIFSFD